MTQLQPERGAASRYARVRKFESSTANQYNQAEKGNGCVSKPRVKARGFDLHQARDVCARSQHLPRWGNHMPIAAPRPCTHPGCGALVRDGSGRCDKHPRTVWKKHADAPKRVTGRKLQAMRAALFARCPLCAECERQGRVTVATLRDHIIPLAEGGTDADDNIQGLCSPCHEAKTQAEAARGRQRAAG